MSKASHSAQPGGAHVRVGSRGELRLPAAVRRRWGVATAGKFSIEEVEDGLLLRPADPPLRKVYVEPTSACNLRCGTCVRNSWSEPAGAMPMETYRRLIDGLRQVPSLRAMSFWGLGEPLLHPDIAEMVALSRGLGARTEIITNGLLLDEGMAKDLIEAGLDCLVVSVDGVTPETHAGARPGADLDTVQENVAVLHDQQGELGRTNPDIGLEFVATRRNLGELPRLRRLAQKMRASFVVVSNVLPYSAEYKDDILYGLSTATLHGRRSPWWPEMVLPRMDASRETLEPLLGLLRHGGLLDPVLRHPEKAYGYCRFVREGAAAVGWDGGVSPCVPLMHSYTCYIMGRDKAIRRYVVGNVNEEPLPALYAREEYRGFRKRVIDFDFAPCADCGGCQYAETNEEDCFGNPFPVCGDCLWARGIIQCP